MTTWTVIDEQRVQTVQKTGSGSADTLLLDPSVLGWKRKPEGLCRDEVCVPVPHDIPPGPIEADALARLLRRPVVIDPEERVASFGASATERADGLRSGAAPDFELPDLDGHLHSLRDFRGKKVVLYAYASW